MIQWFKNKLFERKCKGMLIEFSKENLKIRDKEIQKIQEQEYQRTSQKAWQPSWHQANSFQQELWDSIFGGSPFK